MNKLLLPVLLLSCIHPALAQKDTRARLDAIGRNQELCITPSGAIWAATRSGQTYFTNDVQEDWHVGSQKCEDAICDIYERVQFFNADTGMITGFISEHTGKYNIYYQTTNGGRSWKRKYFADAEGSWIDAFYLDTSGHAWMSGSSQNIYYTADYGNNWVPKGKISDKFSFRLSAIYFQNEREGIAGAFENGLYLTHDNCDHWQKIPTPLDQHQYRPVFKNERPQFDKVLLFHEWILVIQKGRAFYSRQDSIQWIPLPDCRDFSYDQAQDKLWTLNKKFQIGVMNADMTAAWTSQMALPGDPRSIYAANGNLYYLAGGNIAMLNETNFFTKRVYTSDFPIPKPYRTVLKKGVSWGTDNKDIYQSENKGKDWYRVKVCPFEIENFKPLNDSLVLLSDPDYQFYTFNAHSGMITPHPIVHPFQHFLESPIDTVWFESSSHGCFHGYATTVSYARDEEAGFKVIDYKRSDSQEQYPQAYQNAFESERLSNILNRVDEDLMRPLAWSELPITETDKARYLENITDIENNDEILAEQYEIPLDSIDYSFYRAYTDSLHLIPASFLNELLLEKRLGGSTTTKRISMTIRNRAGEKLRIKNDRYEPNAWLLPWTIEYDGLTYPSLNLDFSKFIQENTPGFLTTKEDQNAFLIFQIINKLYVDRVKRH